MCGGKRSKLSNKKFRGTSLIADAEALEFLGDLGVQGLVHRPDVGQGPFTYGGTNPWMPERVVFDGK